MAGGGLCGRPAGTTLLPEVRRPERTATADWWNKVPCGRCYLVDVIACTIHIERFRKVQNLDIFRGPNVAGRLEHLADKSRRAADIQHPLVSAGLLPASN